MKYKEINFLIFALLTFFNVLGQSTAYRINVGLNLSNYKYSINDNRSISSYYNGDRTAVFFGVGVEKPVQLLKNKDFLINGELQYSQQGSSFDSDYIGKQTNYIDQINLLLTLKYKIIKSIYFGAGIYTGYLIYVDEYYREDEETHTNFDFGLVGSLEYRFFKKMSMEFRYLYGISDTLNREFDNGSITHDKHNKVVQIGINYRF